MIPFWNGFWNGVIDASLFFGLYLTVKLMIREIKKIRRNRR